MPHALSLPETRRPRNPDFLPAPWQPQSREMQPVSPEFHLHRSLPLMSAAPPRVPQYYLFPPELFNVPVCTACQAHLMGHRGVVLAQLVLKTPSSPIFQRATFPGRCVPFSCACSGTGLLASAAYCPVPPPPHISLGRPPEDCPPHQRPHSSTTDLGVLLDLFLVPVQSLCVRNTRAALALGAGNPVAPFAQRLGPTTSKSALVPAA